jgi:Uma2 family endonuclease
MPTPGGSGRVVYPERDGEPMGDNTLQILWIMTLVGGLEAIFRDRADVFVAGNHLWYPVEGDPKIRVAPDAMVVFGRPKGYRGSYRQWEEGGIAPQVVFEVISPGNRFGELKRKFEFYESRGVEEYYLIDPGPDEAALEGWQRKGERLEPIEEMDGWVSPRLGIRFSIASAESQLCAPSEPQLFAPDGSLIVTYSELARERDAQRQRAEAERERAEAERLRAERLAERLRRMGVDPDADD